MAILVALLFSKNVYSASLGSYYTFYRMDSSTCPSRWRSSICSHSSSASWPAPLQAGAVGDRVGRSPSCGSRSWAALPFALLLPHANCSGPASGRAHRHDHGLGLLRHPGRWAELLPGRVGLAAGMSTASRSVWGPGRRRPRQLADLSSITIVYRVRPLLLLLGLLTPSASPPGAPARLLDKALFRRVRRASAGTCHVVGQRRVAGDRFVKVMVLRCRIGDGGIDVGRLTLRFWRSSR